MNESILINVVVFVFALVVFTIFNIIRDGDKTNDVRQVIDLLSIFIVFIMVFFSGISGTTYPREAWYVSIAIVGGNLLRVKDVTNNAVKILTTYGNTKD